MGAIANSIFALLLSWVRGAASSLWRVIFEADQGVVFRWLGDNWKQVAIFICILGIIIDVVVHQLRWRTHWVWFSFLRRLFGRSADPVPSVQAQRIPQAGAADAQTARYTSPALVPQEDHADAAYGADSSLMPLQGRTVQPAAPEAMPQAVPYAVQTPPAIEQETLTYRRPAPVVPDHAEPAPDLSQPLTTSPSVYRRPRTPHAFDPPPMPSAVPPTIQRAAPSHVEQRTVTRPQPLRADDKNLAKALQIKEKNSFMSYKADEEVDYRYHPVPPVAAQADGFRPAAMPRKQRQPDTQ